MNEINSRATIFLVEEDNDARRSLTRHLRGLGYRLFVSANVEDAFEWTSGSIDIRADLVLLNLSGKLPDEALTIGRRLRENIKEFGHTPVVVMPEYVPENLQGTDERVNDLEWVCYYEDIDQLTLLLSRVLKPSR